MVEEASQDVKLVDQHDAEAYLSGSPTPFRFNH